ncbi:hypothetical protein E2562_016046 [Oryza meyeriana var. granulata]|uniref:Uncharacterized protein n=1 Tax=Oryza meyeriana var. granulata TaxID=110450 RepID=A0A6G1BLI3_9ORYZ|nr:hypothetical protein E2562_016046 [Oryza meyeriana var. granulata]
MEFGSTGAYAEEWQGKNSPTSGDDATAVRQKEGEYVDEFGRGGAHRAAWRHRGVAGMGETVTETAVSDRGRRR